MAIFHMHFSNISNGKGRSAVASASYRSGESLFDEKEGRNYFYKRDVKPETFILKPKYAPDWCLNRERLWNEVERKENKINSRYAKEFNVALPIELNHDEQKELILNYVQKNFVNYGMVADIAIHRDHKENPHAHVMLTNRPFNKDGTWGNKSKHEYILDKNGNKTYTRAGNVRNRKIWIVDWDKKEKTKEWRKNWAIMVNEQLKKKGLSEKISDKKYSEQGINQTPTIHVGVNKNKNKITYNRLIKNSLNDKKNYDKVQRKLNIHDHYNLFKKNLSYQEKHQIADLSKSLKTYIDYENIDDKRRMIENWKNSILIKKILGVNVNRQIALINKTELDINKANQLLDRVANRMIKKLYPQLKDEYLSVYEKRELIQETIDKNEIYQGKRLKDQIEDIREGILDKRVVTLTKRPIVNLRLLKQWNEKNYNRLNQLLSNYKVDINELINGEKIDKLTQMGRIQKEEVGRLLKNIRNNNTLKKIINNQYEIILKEAFPKIEFNKLENSSKELLYMYTMYYNPELKTYSNYEIEHLIKNTTPKFTHKEHKIGLMVLSGQKKMNVINNAHLKRVLQQQGLQQLFIYECKEDSKLDSKLILKAKNKIEANEKYLDKQRIRQFESYKPLNYADLTASQYRKITFSDTIIHDLMQEDYSRYEREYHKTQERKLEKELTRKQRKENNYKRNR